MLYDCFTVHNEKYNTPINSCYFGNHSNAGCMWNKPNEISTSNADLTTFSAAGYENAAVKSLNSQSFYH